METEAEVFDERLVAMLRVIRGGRALATPDEALAAARLLISECRASLAATTKALERVEHNLELVRR